MPTESYPGQFTPWQPDHATTLRISKEEQAELHIKKVDSDAILRFSKTWAFKVAPVLREIFGGE